MQSPQTPPSAAQILLEGLSFPARGQSEPTDMPRVIANLGDFYAQSKVAAQNRFTRNRVTENRSAAERYDGLSQAMLDIAVIHGSSGVEPIRRDAFPHLA